MSSTKLVTQCPHCDTRFRITAEQLDAAGGKARCSRCQRVFNARAYLQAGDGKASRGESSHRAPHAAAPHSKPPSPPLATESPEFTSGHSADFAIATDADASAGEGQLDFDLASDFEVPGDQFSAQPLSTESADDFQSNDAPSLEPETAWVDASESVFETETLEPRQDEDTFGTALDAAEREESASAFDFDSVEQVGEDIIPAAHTASSVEFSISDGDDLANERADQAWSSSITATAYPVTAITPGELEFGFGELASTEIGAAESDAEEEGILDSPSWAADQPEAIDPLMVSIAEIEAMDVDDHLESIPETLPNPEAATAEPPSDRPAANQTHTDHEPLDDTCPPETSYEQALDALSPKNDATESLFSEWGHSAAAELTDEFPPGDEEAPVEAEDEIAVVFEEAQHPLGSEVLFDEPESEPEPEFELELESESELPESDAAHPLPETEGRTATLYGNALAQELEATLAQRTQRLPTLLFGVGSLVLLALLLVQALNTFRDDVSRYPALAPIAGLFCEAQECVTPEQRAPDRIRIVNRDVRPHPDVAGALLISLSFLNEAEFPQAYPTLEVSFSDIHDQLIALRRFQPSEYLGGERRSSNPLPPGELVALSLSIVDPGEHGVSFRFEFY